MADLIGRRASGVVLHISSLPPAEDGRLGSAARRFVDWLVEAGQSYWQVLPVGPTGFGDSPYQTFSSYAGRADWLGPLPAIDAHDDAVQAFAQASPWLESYIEFLASKGDVDGPRVQIEQYAFDRQWRALRAYANERGVRIIGDCPIYVAGDSAEVMSDPHLFEFGRVAGVPPDYFSATGQRWGNPLYRWDRHRESGYAWWIARLRRCMDLFDITRIDHFRGFDEYWAIDAACDTAVDGEWLPGPGMALFDALSAALGELPFIAEDLGLLTDSVHALRRACHLPGMRVLQFGFDGNPDNPHALHNIGPDTICYTGTHDNDTTLGWYEASGQHCNAGIDPADPVGDLMRRASASAACLAICPMQDVLRLGSDARLNTPGTVGGDNWQWQMSLDVLTAERAGEMKEIAQQGGRARADA